MKRTTMAIVIWAALACLVAATSQARSADSSIKALPVHVQRLLSKVKRYMDEENHDAAIELIRAEVASCDGEGLCTHPLVCLALGNCHLLRSDYPRAESAYLAALSMEPGLTDARVNLAKVYADTHRYGKAAEAFQAAYDLSDPRQPDCLYYSAVMTLMDEKPLAAIARFEALFAAHPDRVTRPWKENYANALITAQHWDRALPVVRELAGHPSDQEKLHWQESLLQIYLTTEKTEQALAYATRLSREAPTRARWWKALVHLHLSRGDYDKALDGLIIYGFLKPLSTEENKLLADLSLQLQIPARAVNMYETLLSETHADDKQKKHLLQHLVQAYRQLDKRDQALALLNRFDPAACDPELLMLKGDILYETKSFKEADEAYRMAAGTDFSRKGQAWLMAGYAAWQSNDLAASRTAFEKASRFKPLRKDALAAITQLERTTQI